METFSPMLITSSKESSATFLLAASQPLFPEFCPFHRCPRYLARGVAALRSNPIHLFLTVVAYAGALLSLTQGRAWAGGIRGCSLTVLRFIGAVLGIYIFHYVYKGTTSWGRGVAGQMKACVRKKNKANWLRKEVRLKEFYSFQRPSS